MLPDFGAMRADLTALVALIERGVVALERIADALNTDETDNALRTFGHTRRE